MDGSPGANVAAALLVAIMGAVILSSPCGCRHRHEDDRRGRPLGRRTTRPIPVAIAAMKAPRALFLRSIRGNAVGIEGIETELRSVGYRLLLQHATAHGWRTTQRGTLVTSAASQTHTAVLHKSRVLRDPDASPNTGRYRLATKVVWYDGSAHVQGTQTACNIENHSRSTNGSVVRRAGHGSRRADGRRRRTGQSGRVRAARTRSGRPRPAAEGPKPARRGWRRRKVAWAMRSTG